MTAQTPHRTGTEAEPGAGLVSGRVSLVVPCYNVAPWLGQFIDSVLAQTHADIEVILVNDGAQDATPQLLRDAVPRLQARGYGARLIEQPNRGLAGAVAAGLQHFTGEFLMWPDPDDWLTPDSVARRVALMRANPDAGLLRTNAALFDETRQVFSGHFMDPAGPAHWQPAFFENLFFMRDYHAPVCHMARSAAFLRANPDRNLFFTRASSQNFQMLAPLVEIAPVLQVPETLAVYRVRPDSRSRVSNASHVALTARHAQILDLVENTLPRLRTCTPQSRRRVIAYHLRNRMLPTAFRGAQRDVVLQRLAQTSLGRPAQAMGAALIAIRSNPLFQRVDAMTFHVASRALARVFDRLVRLPATEAQWGEAPLWSVAGLPAPVILPHLGAMTRQDPA